MFGCPAQLSAKPGDVTLGITLSCPYGLGVCYADVHQPLAHLPGVSWVSDSADKNTWTCRIRMTDGKLVRPSALQAYLTSFRTGATLRGIEATVLGRLEFQKGKPALVVRGQRLPLQMLADTAYWDVAGKKPEGISIADKSAYLNFTLEGEAGQQYVVTGLLKESSERSVAALEVRSFRAPNAVDFESDRATSSELFAVIPAPNVSEEPNQEAPGTGSIKDIAPPLLGSWSTIQPAPIPGVHAHLLPTGNVMFEGFQDSTNESFSPSGTLSALKTPPYNVFCGGHGYMADGRLFFAGGRGSEPLTSSDGVTSAAIYDPFKNLWTSLPEMGIHRWYPGVFLMPNNDMLVLSGSNVASDALEWVPQLWNGTNWVNLTGARLLIPYYPNCYVAPDGRLFMAGSDAWSLYLDTSGLGKWTTGPLRTTGNRMYGPTVMYQPGKILYVSGGSPPTATSEAIDLNAKKPVWTPMATLHYARRFCNATVMPDGTVFVNGGCSGSGVPFDDPTKPVYQSELWDPTTNTWSVTASQKVYRGYHSTSLLMPDGRIYSSGGSYEANVDVYTPAYLSKGPRPLITEAPQTVESGEPFKLAYISSSAISNVSFIRIGSVTHTGNMEQRFQWLNFTTTKMGLSVTAPMITPSTPPGYYMVFLLNSQGVPSVAAMVLLTQTSAPTRERIVPRQR